MRFCPSEDRKKAMTTLDVLRMKTDHKCKAVYGQCYRVYESTAWKILTYRRPWEYDMPYDSSDSGETSGSAGNSKSGSNGKSGSGSDQSGSNENSSTSGSRRKRSAGTDRDLSNSGSKESSRVSKSKGSSSAPKSKGSTKTRTSAANEPMEELICFDELDADMRMFLADEYSPWSLMSEVDSSQGE